LSSTCQNPDVAPLPQTIQDAIRLAHGLDFELLRVWVDSLCIVQDTDDEKLQETDRRLRATWKTDYASCNSRGGSALTTYARVISYGECCAHSRRLTRYDFTTALGGIINSF
ncbi:hypothetical protein C2E23DRAFT_897670, partial [Lenzites betulinus]